MLMEIFLWGIPIQNTWDYYGTILTLPYFGSKWPRSAPHEKAPVSRGREFLKVEILRYDSTELTLFKAKTEYYWVAEWVVNNIE